MFSLACATSEETDEAIKEPVIEVAKPPIDASMPVEPEPAAITTAPVVGTHLDGETSPYQPRGYEPKKAKGKVIDLVLRSTPPGAIASIDGREIGVTPTFWSGSLDPRPHEFTFVKAGHAMARYRFVATHSGVVHGSLTPLQTPKEPSASDKAAP